MSYNINLSMGASAIERSNKLKKTLQEQLDFAEERLIQATNNGASEEQWRWSGYRQALRFIQSEL
jgi:exonuclease VII small subunit